MYNPDAIKAFLTKVDPDAGDGFFHGMPVDAEEAARTQGDYLFHVTRFKNLRSIVHHGLCADHGGQGGAGALLADGEFENDHGWVFASAIPEVVDCYIHEYDSHADAEQSPENIPILLRFHRPHPEVFVEDEQHDGAEKTDTDIPSEELEMLTHDGWVSLVEAEEDILAALGAIEL